MHEARTAEDRLLEECRTFCRYLINQTPNHYVLQKYRDGHRAGGLRRDFTPNRFDQTLVRIAAINTFATRIVDTYTRAFFKTALIRKKLVLLLAILESCAPTHSGLDAAESCTRPMLFMSLLQKLLMFSMVLFFSAIVLAPLRLALGKTPKGSDRLS
jgi:hypothetical protein